MRRVKGQAEPGPAVIQLLKVNTMFSLSSPRTNTQLEIIERIINSARQYNNDRDREKMFGMGTKTHVNVFNVGSKKESLLS